MNIERMSIIFEKGEPIAVEPLDTPTVAKADTASKVASMPVNPFASSGLVAIRVMAVTPTVTTPKNRMASER